MLKPTHNMNTQTALITGASSGIGMHLAHEFASHGHPLILVAPLNQNSKPSPLICERNMASNAHVIAKDLEKPESAQEIFDQVQAKGLEVHILVNNAGHGYRSKTWEVPIEKDLSMICLNIEAPCG
ncbi:MAG: short-chain dehydrogenase/reductase [Verrucomicrobiaceae bacterium]|nr:short-chain dehydrogenase/reductase [Verrucomicrobiaceae bacterium]